MGRADPPRYASAARAGHQGLNCGRWDYIFSTIKRLRNHPEFVLPDRADVSMTVPFMASYVNLLIKTCHRRGVHAMGGTPADARASGGRSASERGDGHTDRASPTVYPPPNPNPWRSPGGPARSGMAAQIPIKNDAAANDAALAKVRADKLREVKAGHDGTWVAHPGLVEIAMTIFNEHMPAPNQLDKLRLDVAVTSRVRPTAWKPMRASILGKLTPCATSPPGQADPETPAGVGRARGGGCRTCFRTMSLARSPRRAFAATSASAFSTWSRGCAAWAVCRSTT